jgi:NADPH2:quinone reductase
MRAIRLSRFGPPAEVLRLEEVPDPEPGPGEVRLRLTHRPINPSDLVTITGLYPIRPTLPGTPGLEGLGRIDALGPSVSGVALGERAVTLAAVPGTWAERMVVPADRVLRVPESVSDQTAAQLLVNPFTAYAMLTDELSLGEGDWLLQTAAGSALGHMVVQLARRRGIRTINAVRRRDQAPDLLALGADAVIATDEEPLVERVLALTGGRGVPAAIEAVGGTLGGEVVRCLAPGGVMLTMGLLSGDLTMPVPSAELLFKGAAVRGFWLTLWFARQPPDAMGRAVEAVLALLADGAITAPVAAEYDLADVHAAVAHAERSGRRGKVLLRG